MKHVKPTKEELEANIKKSQEELEKLEPKPSEPVPSTPPPSPSEPIPSPSQPVPSPSEPIPSPSEPIPSEPEPSKAVDYKKKFTESSREAQILAAKNRKTNEAIDKAAQGAEPTEEDLQKEYSEWDVMSDTEKRFAKEALISKRFREEIFKGREEGKDIETWSGKVDTFIEDPKSLIANPELEGKEDEFRLFANKPTRRGVDFEDIVSAFLFNTAKHAKPKQKGQMFEQGKGGPNDKPKPKTGKISIEDAISLRKNNYGKYKEYVKSGKIDLSSL